MPASAVSTAVVRRRYELERHAGKSLIPIAIIPANYAMDIEVLD